MSSVMQKIKKPIFLLIIIVLPVFLFIFLQTFGTNRYKLPIFYPQGTEVVIKNGKEVIDTIYHHIPEFTLKDQNNNIFNSKDLLGKIYVTDFFFTRCGNPSLCPKMSSELVRIQEAFEKESSVEIVSFTVDPNYDTPKVLKEYANRYNATDGKWHFLTGDKKDIYQLARYSYFLTAGEEEESIKPDFIHAVKFILVDRKGRIRGYYNGVDKEEVDKLILEIKILLTENAN